LACLPQMLLQVDPELAVLPDMSGTMPLHLAAQVGSADLVKLLLAYKPGLEERTLNLNDYSRGDWLNGEETVLPVDATALHLAVESGEAEVVRLLLDAGEGGGVAVPGSRLCAPGAGAWVVGSTQWAATPGWGMLDTCDILTSAACSVCTTIQEGQHVWAWHPLVFPPFMLPQPSTVAHSSCCTACC
jgi:ankyrin repeat protein